MFRHANPPRSSGIFIRLNHVTRAGIEHEVYIPARYIVCERCNGAGKHVNPSVDGHGLTSEDFAEDPDFEEAYFSGVYDVQCEDCKGERVIKDADEARMTKGERIIFNCWQDNEAQRREEFRLWQRYQW